MTLSPRPSYLADLPAHRVEVIGRATLILGDCRTVLPGITGIACVVTDPPFGIDYRSGHATEALWAGGATIAGDATTAVRDQALALLPDVPVLMFGSWKAPRPPGTRAVLVWDKGPALGMGALDIPWKPSAEEIYVLGKGFVGARDEGAVIYHPPVQSMAKNGRRHPNEKPVGLLAKLLRKMPPGMVCDPFMGSASTGEAAIKGGRDFLGIEENPEYFRIACERLHALARQGDLLLPAETSR